MLLVDCRDGDLRQGGGVRVGGLREVAASFVVPGPAGVAIRDRLRVSAADAAVLTEVGVYLGTLAAGDLAERSRQGLGHDAASWAVRKRSLTGRSSARWAGSITKASHDQWALARRGQAAHMAWLRRQIASIEARLGRALGGKADQGGGVGRRAGARVCHAGRVARQISPPADAQGPPRGDGGGPGGGPGTRGARRQTPRE